MEGLPADRRRTAAAALALDAVAVRAVAALRRRELRSLLLRGPAIARWLYPRDVERPYTDVDLLVSPTTFEAAEAVLRKLAFSRTPLEPEVKGDRPRYAHTWIHGVNGAMIDLHWTLPGVRAAPVRLWEELSRETESVYLSGGAVDVPGPIGKTLVLCLNAAQHGREDGRALGDLRLALTAVPEPTWGEAAALARRVDAEEAFASGLRLLPDGARRACKLELSTRRSVATELRAQSAPEMALAFDWLVREAGARDGFRIVLRKVVPSATFLRAWSPLARKGRLGLALAYAWRPLWLVAQALPAYQAWRRARQRVALTAREAGEGNR